jgi:phosphatidylglycerophosphatase A
MKRVMDFLATGLGVGRLAPVAPGTFGTLLGLPLYYFFAQLDLVTWMIAVFAVIVAAVVICHYQEMGAEEHDSSHVVIDEVAGYLVASFALPWALASVVGSFVLFRFFDALKPWPISWIDTKVKGGFGTVADDLAAGLISNFILQVVLVWTAKG